jgi:hypothetical protein
MALNPTTARLELLRAIAAGEVEVGRWGDGRLVIQRAGERAYADGRTVNRFHEFVNAKLVHQVPIFAERGNAQITQAGRAWLAAHDKEN